MLVDGGLIVNLMPYSLFKKLGGTDEELIKTNMMVSGMGGGDPIGAKGVASMDLTVGSKTLACNIPEIHPNKLLAKNKFQNLGSSLSSNRFCSNPKTLPGDSPS